MIRFNTPVIFFLSTFSEVLHTATIRVTQLRPMSARGGARNWELLVGSIMIRWEVRKSYTTCFDL